MKRSLLGLALVVALLAIATLVGAQSLTGTVTGRVTDEQGGVLPGVNVTLTGKTGSQTQVTDAKGEFRFLGLEPGNYEVKSEISGFRPKAETVVVNIGKTVDLKVALGVGGLTETVEVVANAVTIDTTTTATDTNLNKDLLFSMPLTHQNPATNLLNYAPGVNSGSAFGGTADYGNALLLDGVDTRDPAGGSAWTFFGYNIVEEVQVGGLGQPAEYGGFTGAVVNTITKSGGNRFASMAEYRWTNKSLSSNNVSQQIATANPGLANPTVWDRLNDYTVQLSGPIKKDKVFFFGSIQRYSIKENPDGPRTIRTEVSPRFNFKLTSNLTANDTFTGSFQWDEYNQGGRTAGFGGTTYTTDYRARQQDSPESIWNLQYRKVFGATTFLEAKFTGYNGYYYLDPYHAEPVHWDENNNYTGGAGSTYYADRGRNQLNVSLSKYAEMAGTHNFKFGVEIERSKIRDRYSYSLGTLPGVNGEIPVTFYDYGGAPYMAYSYTYDIQGRNKRESFYAQDQWKMGRVTANIGFRFDAIRGYSPILNKTLYDTKSPAPRLGFAWDVTGKGTSVFKAFYGQLYEGPQYYTYNRALPGIGDYVTYLYDNDLQKYVEDSRISGASKYTMANDLKHPRTDEFNIAYEQQLFKVFKFTGTYIHRSAKNFVDSVLNNGQWTMVPFPKNDSLGWAPGVNPKTGQPMQIFWWANKGAQQFTIQNVNTVNYLSPTGQVLASTHAYRDYDAVMLVFQRALKNRWQAQVSYVWSRNKGTVNNDGSDGLAGYNFENPNTAIINREGTPSFDRTHEVKIFAGYQIPVIDVGVNVYYRATSGLPYTPYARLSSGSKYANWPSSLNVYLQPRGTYRGDTEQTVDLRLEKVVQAGIYRFGIYMDAANLLNEGAITGNQTRFPDSTISNTVVPFGGPTAVAAGRQITFGGRWSF